VTIVTKVKITGLAQTLKLIRELFAGSAERKEMLDEILDFVVRRVRAETRKGKDLSRDGETQPPLSTKYIAARERMTANGSVKVDKTFFSPKRSNLTLTGQMLDSLSGLVKSKARSVEVFVEGRRDDGLTNQAVAKDLKSMGRTFLGLDEKGRGRIRKIVLDEIRRQIRLRK